MAAPEAPIFKVKISTGSIRMFTTLPPTLPIMDSLAIPSARSRFVWIKVSTTRGAPRAIQV